MKGYLAKFTQQVTTVSTLCFREYIQYFAGNIFKCLTVLRLEGFLCGFEKFKLKHELD